MTRDRDFLLWTACLALLALGAFASRSYTPIDETRYLSVAWEMWQRGDWLVPFKNGEPYSHKPPLLFWLIQAGWWLGGVNEWWPRLVSPLFALAALWLTRRIAAQLWPECPEATRLAPWILLGSLLWAFYVQTVMFDALMTFWVLVGVWGLLRVGAGDGRAWWFLALAIGLGILSKGPAVFLHLLPPALLAPWWLPAARVDRRRWYGRLLLAVCGGALVALAWAVPAGIHGGQAYRNAIFWGQTANRMVESFAHQRPLWWYLPLLTALLFPWLVWPPLWRRLRTLRRSADAGQRLVLAWMLPAFLAFSLVSGKQVHYLLPEFPAFALLAARLLAARGAPSRPWLPAAVVALLGLAVLLLPVLHLPRDLQDLAQAPAWGGAGFLLLAWWMAATRGEPADQVVRLSLASQAATLLVGLVLIRSLAAGYDVRPMSREIAAVQARGLPVAHFGEYHAQFQFAGRLSRPLAEVRDRDAMQAWLAAHPDGAVVLYPAPRADISAYRPLFVQPYLNGRAALFRAGDARAYLSGKTGG